MVLPPAPASSKKHGRRGDRTAPSSGPVPGSTRTLVLIEVDWSSILPSTRPTVWVMNWVLAACLSCSSQLISTMRQPSDSQKERKALARSIRRFSDPIRTWMHQKGDAARLDQDSIRFAMAQQPQTKPPPPQQQQQE